MNPDEFWSYLERMITGSCLIIARAKGSRHPHYPDILYPLDYGYLDSIISSDGSGIDVWAGASGTRDLSAVILTVDLHKRVAEIKILLGCTEMKFRAFSRSIIKTICGRYLLANQRSNNEEHS